MMDFARRKAIASELLADFLGDLVPPRGMDDDRQEKTALSIADAFARRMPVTSEEAYRDGIAGVFAKIRDTHKGYSWPAQADFVDLMPAGSRGKAPQTFRPEDADAVHAANMRAGEPVPETAIWDSAANRMLGAKLIDRPLLETYRRGSAQNYVSAYRNAAGAFMEERLGPQVRPYVEEAQL